MCSAYSTIDTTRNTVSAIALPYTSSAPLVDVSSVVSVVLDVSSVAPGAVSVVLVVSSVVFGVVGVRVVSVVLSEYPPSASILITFIVQHSKKSLF